MDILIQAVISGILIGGVFALISVGLTLIFGVMDVVNFAQGEFLMLGMYGAYFLWFAFDLDPLISAVIIGAILFAFGTLIERFLIEPIIKTPQISQIFVTVGLGIVLKNLASAIFGNSSLSVQTSYQTSVLNIGNIDISVPYLVAFGFALVFTILLNIFLNYTKFGYAMRATSQNRDSAVLLGINPRFVYMGAFGLGIGLTGLAGAIIMPYTTATPYVGEEYVLIMFTVVVLGGLSSINGAIIAGFIIGLIQSVSSVFLPIELQNLMVFLVFFFALVFLRGGVIKRVLIKT